jgi:predicted ABC-type ATPase
VRIWYVGLHTPELHLQRVRSRVDKGGHDIPEARIRERYTRSRLNLIGLIPNLTELLVYDNSKEAKPHAGITPEPALILHLHRDKIVKRCDLAVVPDWAKPIMLTVLKNEEHTS